MNRQAIFTGIGLLALSALGSAQFKVIERWTVGGDGGWDYLTVESKSHRLFVSRFDRVEVFDTQSGKKVGVIPDCKGVHQAVWNGKGVGFTSNGGSNDVSVFDMKSLKTTGRVAVGKRPDAIIYDSASNRVFTFNAGSQDMTAIDATTLKVVGSVPLGGKPEFPQVDGKGMLYVNIEDKSQIAAIDTKALKETNRWSIAPGEGPSGLALDRAHGRLFSVTDGKMVVSDVAGKVVSVVPIGDGPDGAAYDAKLGLAFSSNGAGTLTVVKEVSPDKFEVLQNLATERGARTCVIDESTHRIYLVTAKTETPAGGGRRRVIPGTFTILVVGRK